MRKKGFTVFLVLAMMLQSISFMAPKQADAYSNGQTFSIPGELTGDTSKYNTLTTLLDMGAPGVNPFEHNISIEVVNAQPYSTTEIQVSQDGSQWFTIRTGTAGSTHTTYPEGAAGLAEARNGHLSTVRYVRVISGGQRNGAGFWRLNVTLGPVSDTRAPTQPRVTVSPTGYTNGNVTAVIDGSIDNETAVKKYQYMLGGATTSGWTDYTGPVTISNSGLTQITARALDYNDNVSATQTAIAFIDKVAPSAPGIAADHNGWYSGDKVITVTHGSDALSGVEKTQFQINSEGYQDYTGPFTLSSRATITARTIDKVGNISAYTSYDTQIDKTPPNPPSITADRSGWYNGNKVISVTHGTDTQSGVLKSQYRVYGSGSWIDYTGPFTATDRVTYEARTLDLAGNASAVRALDTLIDKTPPNAPRITPNITGWYNRDKIITVVNGSDDSSGTAKSQVQIDNGSWSDYTGPFSVSERVRVNARTLDQAGNISAVTSLDTQIDKSTPTGPSITTDHAGWYNADKVVTIGHGQTGPSGVQVTQVRIDNGSWTPYTAPFIISTWSTVESRTLNQAGNASPVSSLDTQIDKVAPAEPTVEVTGGADWQSGNKSVTITHGTDSGGSGVKETEYRINGGNWAVYTDPVLVTEEGQTIEARTWDQAGNVSNVASADIRIDKTPPTSPIIQADPDQDTAGNIEITITPGTDTVSGVKVTEYKVGASSSWQPYLGTFSITTEGEHQVFARSTDNAGNISVIASLAAIIDRTPPTAPSINLSTDNYTAGDVQFTINGSTDARDFHYEYKLANGSYSAGDQGEVTEDGLTVITARAVDAAGNISGETTKTIRIDKKDPAIQITPTQRGWSADPIAATIRYEDDGSGINPDRRYYKVTNSSAEPTTWDQASSNNFQVNIVDEGTWYIHAKVEDNVGNSTVATSSAMRLQLPPESPVLSLQSIGLNQATLQWTLPGGHTYTDGYEYILRNLTNGHTMNVTHPGDRVIDSSLSAGTSYEYELIVRNHVGETVSDTLRALTLPAAPSNLVLAPIDRVAGQITASFDAVKSAESYRIVAINMDSQQEVYNQTVTDSVYQPVMNLYPGTKYNVAVSAINAAGEGPSVNQSILTLPDSPEGFKTVSIGENSVDLTWYSVTTATYYALDRDGLPVTESVYEAYTDSGLSSGTRYDYRLAAINTTGPGAYSHLNVLTLPGMVNGLAVVEARRNELQIAWNRVHGASGYRIVVNGVQVYQVGETELRATISDLPAGTAAQISIQAENSSGLSVTSSTYGLTLPDQPDGISISDIQERSAIISWTPVHGATKYEVELDDQKYTVTDNSLVARGLTGGTMYPVSVAAGNTSGYGEAKKESFLTLPAQVVGFSAIDPQDRSFTLSWEPVKSAVRYMVYQGQNEIGTVNDHSIKVKDLNPGNNYQFSVRAENASGIGTAGEYRWRTYPSGIESGAAWITEVTTSSAAAEWLQVAGADYYRVYLDGELQGDTDQLKHYFEGFESSERHMVWIEPVNSSGTSQRYELPFETLPDGAFKVSTESKQTSITVTVTDTKPNDIIVVAHKGEVIYKGTKPVFVWEPLKANTEYVLEVWTENQRGDMSDSQFVTVRTKSGSKPIAPAPSETMRPDVPPVDVPVTVTVPDEPVVTDSRSSIRFSDTEKTFNRDKIQKLADEGVVKGTSDTTFEPYREVTRAEFASMLVRALHLPEEPDTTLTFEDIQPDGWYIPELKTAIKHVVARGFSDHVFAPDRLISREQASKMVGNVVLDVESSSFGGFYTDEFGIADWAKTEVLSLTKESMLQGYPDGSFRPKQNVTRAEAAEMIYNLLYRPSTSTTQ